MPSRPLVLVLCLLAPLPAFAQEAAPPAPEAPPPTGGKKWTADELVALALRDSGQVSEAVGKVTEWKGRLAEVESVFYPKLQGLTYVAPIFGLKPYMEPYGEEKYEINWSQWGPYYKLQFILAQPIYTFGRVSAGKDAAENRMLVEQARLEQTKNLVALEVRKYYLLHLFAQSMKPALGSAKRILDEAEKSAKEMFAEGGGKVTQVDLQKLRYGQTELAKFVIQAEIGAELALAALKHTVGLPQNAPLELADEMLPGLPEAPLPTLAQLIQQASAHRPEVSQLKYGEKAAMSLEQAERLSSAPVLAVAGQIDFNWAPTWPNPRNSFDWNRFNNFTPGVALALQFDVDIAKSNAKALAAHGLVEQVEGLKKFASTGIPMEVRKAHDDYVQAEKLVKLSDEGAVAGRKWMIFAGSAYVAGTGEAKDLLEGMVAYLQGKKGYYENLQALHYARANILYATGRHGAAEAAAPK
jgi:outer membrane protein TolC